MPKEIAHSGDEGTQLIGLSKRMNLHTFLLMRRGRSICKSFWVSSISMEDILRELWFALSDICAHEMKCK